MNFKPSFFVDVEWMNKMSFKLDRFKRVSRVSHLYNCRCPVCGDSKKDKRKARFFFYEKKGSLNVDCKNCGYGRSFWNFMKEVFPNDFEDYKKDQLKERLDELGKNKSNENKKIISTPTSSLSQYEDKETKTKNIFNLNNCISINKLDERHPAKLYLRSRCIPDSRYDELYYCDDFYTLASSISYKELEKNNYKEGRIIIPFFSKDGKTIEMIQGRSLSTNPNVLRYITIKTSEDVDKIYNKNNIDKNKTVYCVEGPFDSMFIDNCLATCDSSIWRAEADVYISDNEPRNKEIVKVYEKLINMNKSLVIWPDLGTSGKIDINDMMIMGLSQTDLMTIIKENTYTGLMAKLKLAEWRKV